MTGQQSSDHVEFVVELENGSHHRISIDTVTLKEDPARIIARWHQDRGEIPAGKIVSVQPAKLGVLDRLKRWWRREPGLVVGPDLVFESALSALSKIDAEEAAKLMASTAAVDGQRSLEKLFDYTKFHIGLYLTLTSIYVAAASIKGDKAGFLLSVDLCLFRVAVACFFLAGLAGGVIASSITQTTARSSESFLMEYIGPVKWKCARARTWTWVEHISFWIGLIAAFASIRLAPPPCVC